MLIQQIITSDEGLDFALLTNLLGVTDVRLVISPTDMAGCWAFYREEHSVTLFLIEKIDGAYVLSMDGLAAYDDYRFWPYLLDTLTRLLTHAPYQEEGKTAYQQYDENWVAYTMGEVVAYLKCHLVLNKKFYISLPIQEQNLYVSHAALRAMGVCIYSSTPRIFGYIHYMLNHQLLPYDEVVEDLMIDEEVDVPQHQSIGTVQSWQTDGAITTESYSLADTQLLLNIAHNYQCGMLDHVEGVVLNDIGTIHEHGIGTPQDAQKAIYWYGEAIKHGDLLYAPTNMGDIYRKGLPPVVKDLRKAVDAYMHSTDPYAWFRIGQSYEEGWVDCPNLEKAMLYYRKAAKAGHHLAVKRLKGGSKNSEFTK